MDFREARDSMVVEDSTMAEDKKALDLQAARLVMAKDSEALFEPVAINVGFMGTARTTAHSLARDLKGIARDADCMVTQ